MDKSSVTSICTVWRLADKNDENRHFQICVEYIPRSDFCLRCLNFGGMQFSPPAFQTSLKRRNRHTHSVNINTNTNMILVVGCNSRALCVICVSVGIRESVNHGGIIAVRNNRRGSLHAARCRCFDSESTTRTRRYAGICLLAAISHDGWIRLMRDWKVT